MTFPDLGSVRSIFDAILKDVETPVTEKIDSLYPIFNSLPSESQTRLMKYVDESIKLSCAELKEKYADCDKKALSRETELQVLFVLECRKFCLTFNPEMDTDDGISDWISEHLGRLSLCLPDRAMWKTFMHSCIVERYGKMFGRILYNVYLNLGLEPPDCLPRDDSDITGTPSREDLLSDGGAASGSALQSEHSPVTTSEPNTRSQLRHSLPRALFADTAIVAAAAATVGTAFKPVPAKEPHSRLLTSTPNTGSGLSSGDSIPHGSQSSGGPQLVLISCPRSRRKCRTPTKRTPINHSSRRTKNNSQTPPTDKSLPSTGRKRATPNQQSKQSSSSRSRHSSGRHSKAGPKSQQSSCSGIPGSAEPRSVKTPERRYRRSVHETPNPERSYPRWERARLAAAEKTKDKVIVVEESPIKPTEPIGSPLRRLRRANSMLASLCYVEAKEAALLAATGCVSNNRLSQDSCDALHSSVADSGCLSVAMSRAERWRRRQFEEECSLSQFADQPVQFDLKSSPPEQQPPSEASVTDLSLGSGLLCNPGSLRRRSSNLFANMTSPEQLNGRRKTPRKNIFCKSPPIKSPKRICPPAFSVSPPLQPLRNGNRIHSPPPCPLPKSPVTTPTTQRRLPDNRTRVRRPSGNAPVAVRVVPISPQVFDEEAMFLGREEFLNETNTTPSVGVGSPLRTGSNETDDGWESEAVSSTRKRQRCSPVPSSMNPPIMRLNSLPKIIESMEPAGTGKNSGSFSSFLQKDPSKRPMRRRPKTTAVATTPKKGDASQAFPFLPKPIRSPFAPLHVFTRSTTATDLERTNIPGDLFDCTATMSSQSASTVLALRTRLFGNSNSNEPDATEAENRPTLSTGNPQPLRCSAGPSPEHSRHPWDENSQDIAFSPGLLNLKRTAQENAELNVHVKGSRPQPSTTSPPVRHRRSLFS